MTWDADRVIERNGAWILMGDYDGRRHGWKIHAIQGISDLDVSQTSTVVSVSGGRQIVIEAPLETVADELAL